jgi:CDP-diacylglycerol--glycerol-3-phosphate 3-phosphatidyltransferase
MTPGIRDLLLASVSHDGAKSPSGSGSHGTVLTAHPEANGFYGSKGVSGMLPPAYTLLAKRFLRAVQSRHLSQEVQLMEWKRGTCGQPNGWTYHAKGLWVTLPEAGQPSVTLIGSSNYTARSHTLDLEANALVLTTNKDLQQRLGEEERHLREEYAKPVDMDEFSRTERRVGWKVRVALWIVGLVGGAL